MICITTQYQCRGSGSAFSSALMPARATYCATIVELTEHTRRTRAIARGSPSLSACPQEEVTHCANVSRPAKWRAALRLPRVINSLPSGAFRTLPPCSPPTLHPLSAVYAALTYTPLTLVCQLDLNRLAMIRTFTQTGPCKCIAYSEQLTESHL